jgi:hypothetical protein
MNGLHVPWANESTTLPVSTSVRVHTLPTQTQGMESWRGLILYSLLLLIPIVNPLCCKGHKHRSREFQALLSKNATVANHDAEYQYRKCVLILELITAHQ